MENTRFRPGLAHTSAFIAAGAVVVGDVHLGAESSVWFNSVLRGDVERITIGEGTNVQDGCLLHTSHNYPLFLAEGVSVGHGAVVHGARVGTNSLVGIRAILLDGVEVGKNCLIAAGSLLAPEKRFPDGVLIMGTPARVVRPLTPKEIANNRRIAQNYIARARLYKSAAQKDAAS